MAVAGDTSYLASGLLEVISSDAIIKLDEAGVTRFLVRNEYRPNADTITIQVWNNGTHKINYADVGAVTDGTEVGAAFLGSEKKTATLAPYAVRSDIYDDSRYSSQDNLDSPIGTILGNAMAEKWDYDLNEAFDDFSQTVGTSTVGLTVDNLYSAYTYLEAASAPGTKCAVLHSNQITGAYGLMNDLVTSQQFGGSPELQNQGLKEAWVDRVAGIDIYKSNLIAESGSARKGGIFVKEALSFCYSGPPSGIKIEPERQASYLRDIYVISSFYGLVECVDTFGVEVHTKTS